MDSWLAPLMGGAICCIVPLLAFAAGVVYARRGSPVRIAWGWKQTEEE